MLFQTLFILFWVLFVGVATTVAGKWIYDNWYQPLQTMPTSYPTSAPSTPTFAPTVVPTFAPTTAVPTAAPTTAVPTGLPTVAPTSAPTVAPTAVPTTFAPSALPTPAPTSDNCFELAYYFCLTCVPPEMQPTLPCGRTYFAPGKCPENAVCYQGRYTCNPGYKSTYVAPFPNPWGDYCQHCSLSHTCVPDIPTYLRH